MSDYCTDDDDAILHTLDRLCDDTVLYLTLTGNDVLGKVVIHNGTRCSYTLINPVEARELAEALSKFADEVDELVGGDW